MFLPSCHCVPTEVTKRGTPGDIMGFVKDHAARCTVSIRFLYHRNKLVRIQGSGLGNGIGKDINSLVGACCVVGRFFEPFAVFIIKGDGLYP